MNNKLKNIVIAVLTICCISLVVVLSLTFKKFTDYRTWIPPVTTPDSQMCKIPGLESHWKFDQINANSTPDETGKHLGEFQAHLHINYVSNLVYGRPKQVDGKKGKALDFSGKHWISGGNSSGYNVEKFTIALWVYQNTEDYTVPTLVAKSAWEGYDGWWLCTFKDRFLDLGIAWGNGFTHIESGYQLPLNEWHYVAVSVDNINHEVQFYVDGKPYGEKHTGVPKWLVNWNHDLFIGDYDGSGNWPWRGKLDDVRFYSKVLSPEEVLEIYSTN